MKKITSLILVMLITMTVILAVPNDEKIVEVSSELGIDYATLKSFVYEYYGLEESENTTIIDIGDYIEGGYYTEVQKIRFCMTFEQTTDAYMLSKNCEVAIMDSYYQFPIADILPREEAKLQDLNPGDILIMEGMTGYRSAIDNCRILEVIKPE